MAFSVLFRFGVEGPGADHRAAEISRTRGARRAAASGRSRQVGDIDGHAWRAPAGFLCWQQSILAAPSPPDPGLGRRSMPLLIGWLAIAPNVRVLAPAVRRYSPTALVHHHGGGVALESFFLRLLEFRSA